jgi:hypothetical protein
VIGTYLRLLPLAALLLLSTPCLIAQQAAGLPDAPTPAPELLLAEVDVPVGSSSSAAPFVFEAGVSSSAFYLQAVNQPPTQSPAKPGAKPVPLDRDGVPVPIERQQPQRILGFMPNFRTVSAGSKPHPPGWDYNFKVATHQALDYSSFIFLGLTSLSAKALDEHPSLGKGPGGLWAYTWRGFLDKTDGTYLSAWLLPSLLHEDTRFYPLGHGHSIPVRALYVISRQGVGRTYGGRDIPNVAGLGGKVLTQYISRFYYPTGASDFGVLAEKFGYSVMRDVIFTSIREFYPDIAAHYIRKHREKVAALALSPSPATP